MDALGMAWIAKAVWSVIQNSSLSWKYWLLFLNVCSSVEYIVEHVVIIFLFLCLNPGKVAALPKHGDWSWEISSYSSDSGNQNTGFKISISLFCTVRAHFNSASHDGENSSVIETHYVLGYYSTFKF